MATHILRVVHTSEGESERAVNGNETVCLRSNGTLRSWPPKELLNVTVSAKGVLELVHADNRGSFQNLRPADVLEIGSDKFAIGELVSLALRPIAKPVKLAPHEQPASQTWRVRFRDPDRPELDVTFGSGALVQGERIGAGNTWEPPVTWGALLDDIATLERVDEP